MRKKLVAGNWKMFTTAATARQLAAAVAAGVGDDRVDVLLCPPFPYLSVVGEAIKGSRVALGAQNCYSEKEGPFTGEVGPGMLRDVGCGWIILGHSERRHKMGETDQTVNRKVHLALEVGLKVILCVGETLHERMSDETEHVVLRQLTGCVEGVPRSYLQNLTLAYEPVWAIGTGHNATPEQAQKVHSFVRGKVASLWGETGAQAVRILYGGSVKASNAAQLMNQPDVDGGLIGGASLVADEFLSIIRACA